MQLPNTHTHTYKHKHIHTRSANNETFRDRNNNFSLVVFPLFAFLLFSNCTRREYLKSPSEREFKIRCDYVFHHHASTWIFSHSVLRNATMLSASSFSHAHRETCTIIYCFSLWNEAKQRRKKCRKKVLLLLFRSRRAAISNFAVTVDTPLFAL